MLKVQNASNQAMEVGKHMYFYKNTLLYCKNVTERNTKVCSFFPQLKRMQTCTITGEAGEKSMSKSTEKQSDFINSRKAQSKGDCCGLQLPFFIALIISLWPAVDPLLLCLD